MARNCSAKSFPEAEDMPFAESHVLNMSLWPPAVGLCCPLLPVHMRGPVHKMGGIQGDGQISIVAADDQVLYAGRVDGVNGVASCAMLTPPVAGVPPIGMLKARSKPKSLNVTTSRCTTFLGITPLLEETGLISSSDDANEGSFGDLIPEKQLVVVLHSEVGAVVSVWRRCRRPECREIFVGVVGSTNASPCGDISIHVCRDAASGSEQFCKLHAAAKVVVANSNGAGTGIGGANVTLVPLTGAVEFLSIASELGNVGGNNREVSPKSLQVTTS